MSPVQVEAGIVYQPLTEPKPQTLLSRISSCCTMKNVTLTTLGIATIATTVYLATHGGSAKEANDDFPHDGFFPVYCRESCRTLYNYNPYLVKACDDYCDGSSEDTFPKACILACNKLGILGNLLLKCVRSCKD